MPIPPPSRDIAAPWPVKPRQQIVQLRQLHLKLAFAGARPPRENVQDELGAVQHLHVQRLLQIALLRRRQFAIEDHHGRFVKVDLGLQLVDLAGADQRGRVGAGARSGSGSRRPAPGAGGKRRQFFDGFLRADEIEAARRRLRPAR